MPDALLISLLMKKVFSLFAATILTLSSLSAQEAFKHLGASVEFGTTGLGVNISYPVITNRLIVSVGYNFPSYSIKSSFDLNGQPINERINAANSMIDQYNNMVNNFDNLVNDYPFLKDYISSDFKMTAIDHIETVDKVHADIDAKLNFGNFKVMAEYYPTTKSFFHITAGFMIGNGEWMDIYADAERKAWNTYIKAIEQNATIPTIKKGQLTQGVKPPFPGFQMPEFPNRDIAPVEGLDESVKFTINNDTYLLSPESNGHLNTKLTINKFKPYIGVGFGSSVPTERRVGFQMEIGAYYQGKPTFESKYITKYDPSAFSNKTVDDVVEMLQYLRWYPQLTFRITGRIF